MTTTPTDFPNKCKFNITLEKNMKEVFFSSFYLSNIWGGTGYYSEDNKTQSFFISSSKLMSVTYVLKQCAAVTSHVLLIKVAPHWCTLLCWREACHGQAALAAMSPDIILLTINGTARLPQPERDEIIKLWEMPL